MRRRCLLLGTVVWLAAAMPANAFLAYVSNEKSNTVSVIDTDKWVVTKTIKVGQRPRGIEFTKDGKFVLVAVGDDDTIQMIDTAIQKVVDTLPSGPDPELFVQDAAGKFLYVANENDNTVTIIDIEKRSRIGDVQVGVEPEGMAISPDGRILINTSETTNMAHFIDTRTRQIVANVLVDARPRFAEFKRDGSELWVSSEIGGTVAVIDPSKQTITKKIAFNIPGMRSEAIQPVGISITRDGKTAFVALGPANRHRRRRWREPSGHQVPAGRSAGVAHGVHAGRKIPANHERRVERRLHHRRRRAQSDQDHPGRRAALGRHDLTAMRETDTPINQSATSDSHHRTQPVETVALSIEGVSHFYGSRQALEDVSFTVAPATFTALLGLNGAGKSSLFSLVTRLFDVQTGNIRIFGHDIRRDPGEALRVLGVVFQPRTLDLDLSVTQNLVYHAALHGIGKREALSRAGEELTRIGLADRAGDKVRNLSGGQMRRLEIAARPVASAVPAPA